MSLSCLGHHLIVAKQRINPGAEHAVALDHSTGAVPIYHNAVSKPPELSWRSHVWLAVCRRRQWPRCRSRG